MRHQFTWETTDPHKCVVNRKLGTNGEVARLPVSSGGEKIGFCQHCNFILYFTK